LSCGGAVSNVRKALQADLKHQFAEVCLAPKAYMMLLTSRKLHREAFANVVPVCLQRRIADAQPAHGAALVANRTAGQGRKQPHSSTEKCSWKVRISLFRLWPAAPLAKRG
jgi:hypothetical protein